MKIPKATLDAMLASGQATLGPAIDMATMQANLPIPFDTSALQAKQPKYGNEKVVVGGMKFDSKKEARRWLELKMRLLAGEITDLEFQPVYRCEVNGKLICKYIGDARYIEAGKIVVEDTKSAITRKNRTYRIKLKLMKALHGIVIREV